MRLSVLLALLARKLNAAHGKERAVGAGVAHLDEPRVEVDLRGQRRYRDQLRAADREDRRHGLIEKALIAISSLFQHQHVATRALGRPDLHTTQSQISSMLTIRILNAGTC